MGMETAGLQLARSEVLEREERRLTALRRRQERELASLVAAEMAKKQQRERAQEKVRMLEQRAEAQRAQRVAEQLEWQRQVRERELQKKRVRVHHMLVGCVVRRLGGRGDGGHRMTAMGSPTDDVRYVYPEHAPRAEGDEPMGGCHGAKPWRILPDAGAFAVGWMYHAL